jgi:hypothetical protein
MNNLPITFKSCAVSFSLPNSHLMNFNRKVHKATFAEATVDKNAKHAKLKLYHLALCDLWASRVLGIALFAVKGFI